MRKAILVILFMTSLIGYGQVKSIVFESKDGDATYNDLKNVTVHVIIKDFCDDTKPYKKILEENWKHSKLSFDYEAKYDKINESNKGLCQDGEWYMFIERSIGQKTNGGAMSTSKMNFSNTEICIVKAKGKKRISFDYVISIPIYPAPGKDKEVGYPYFFVQQNVDVAKCFFNLSNEYYLKNTLSILDQYVDKKVSNCNDYAAELSCAPMQEVLKSTLFVPQYVLLKSSKYREDVEYVNAGEYFKGYESKYKVLSNEEIIKKFKGKEPFYYLLYSAGYGKWQFIVEGTTGKIISVSGANYGYNIDKGDMADLFDNLKNNKKCK